MGFIARLGVSVALTAAAVAVPGCVSVASSPIAEATAARDEAARRTGVAIPPPVLGADDPSVDPVIAGLLAKPLTEDAAVKIALLNNRSVREGYERLGIARADLIQAGLISNPVFSANLKSFSAGPEIELGLAQSFIELFFVPLRQRVAASDLCAAQAAVARDLVRLVFHVRRALVAARSAEGLFESRRTALKSAQASQGLMKRIHEAGNVVDSQMTLAEMGAARAQLDLDAAETLAHDARADIDVLLGLRGATVRWTVDGRLPPLPDPERRDVEVLAVSSSLDLVESRARIESAMTSAGLVASETAWSRLDLGAVAKREPDGEWGVGPEISVALPIFDSGQAKRLRGCAEVRERLARHVQVTVEVETAARRLRDRSGALHARAKSLAESYLPLQARFVREVRQSYNAMQIGAFEVLDAQQHEVGAQREYAETLREAWLARLDLDELLAGSLDRDRLAALQLPRESDLPSVPKGR
jgi:cobalt-zinc-cadmium efflux system outer membrane protein